ncbi:MAG: IS66 family transposase [Promethearchaeota archaeon]
MNKERSDDIKELKKLIRKLKEEKEHLKEELDKERQDKYSIAKRKRELEQENEDLKEQLSQLRSSAPFLGASDRTAEAGGVPSSKTYYRRNRTEGNKKPMGGQPGHKGHGRKKPVPNAPPIHIKIKICPHCHNPNINEAISATQKRTVTDIPPPSHNVYEIIYHRYWCSTCKKLVRDVVPWLPPNQEFGPFIACWIAYHRILGLTLPKIRSSLYETYGIEISDGTVLKLEKWVAETLQDDYSNLKENIAKADVVNADETKFRIGGENGWLWTFVNSFASLYVVAPTRGHDVPVEVLEGFDGVLGRDAWKPYDFVKCSGHQMDLLHVNRWLERAEIRHCVEPRTILTSKPMKLNRRGRPPEKFLNFVDGVRAILKKGIEYAESESPLTLKERQQSRKYFEDEMGGLLEKNWKDKDVIRISKELRKRLNMLFTFVEIEGVPWHNNDAERAIRKGVLIRKISGGRRTWKGAGIFQVLLSITETAKKNGENFIQLIKKKLGVPSRAA